MSLLDFFRARQPETPAVKAVTGPGAVSMEINPPLRSLRNTPQALAKQALELYHTSEWINTAESLIDDKYATVKWHLEDADGETVDDDDSDPVRQDILRFLRRPNPLWSRDRFLALTARHQGMVRCFWYLDSLDTVTGVPRWAYIIHPGRMWAATDKGGNLIGWVMDADRPDGREPTPFSLDEILQIPLEAPDSGYYGVGKAQAAWRKALLTQHTDEYAAGMFASGGRIPGLIFPSNGVTFANDDDFRSFVHAVRDSTEGMKRMSALRTAVDYVRTAEPPNALELPDLSTMSRDDTLAIWKVPKSQVGLEAKTGLNGGERNKYDEAALWQNAIEPRLSTLAALLQERILDQHGLTLILETPNFDDDLPLYEIAEKARYAPQTVDERRALLGMGPLDPATYKDMGTWIFMDNQLTQVWPEPVVPEPLQPFAGNDDSGARSEMDEMPEMDVSAKAKLHFEALRAKVEKNYTGEIERAVQGVLSAQRADIAAAINAKGEHVTAKPDDVRAWWNEAKEYERLQSALEPIVLRAASDVTRTQSATFFRPVKADSILDRVLDYVRTKVGQRITGINSTTRDNVRQLVAQGVTEGLSPRELGDRIESATFFDEARAEMIARTETAYAYNDSSIGTYRNFQVEEVQVLDGDSDEVCARVNGAIWSLDEANADPIAHPNCVRDFVPIVKAVSEAPHFTFPITVNVPEQPAPVITVEATTVNVPEPKPPVVNVAPAVVNVPAAKAAGLQEVRVVEMPRRVHQVLRRNGEVTGSVEEDDE